MMGSMKSSMGGGEFDKKAAGLRNYNKRKERDCKYYFSKLDYEILRPLLIYKYERDEMHR